MNYQVYSPVPELRPFVKCFWTLDDEGSQEPVRQRILPDGCIEMIFHYGDLFRQYFEDGTNTIQPRCFVFGQITKFIEIAPTGKTGTISARFLPGGLLPFLHVDISSLENKAVSMGELFGEKGEILEESVIAANNNKDRQKLIESFLLSLLEDPKTIDKITRDCVEVILQSQGQTDMDELAGLVNVNRRNIERRFASSIGMSPKQLSRVVRLQATLRMLEQKNFTSLTSLAYENGYYDQAHFIKDFKEFTGIKPKSFYAKNLRLAALFASTE